MRIGIHGGIHANEAALAAVLGALDAEGCDQIVCTGDVVGYGPRPAVSASGRCGNVRLPASSETTTRSPRRSRAPGSQSSKQTRAA